MGIQQRGDVLVARDGPRLISQPSFFIHLQWELSTRWQCNTTHSTISSGGCPLVEVSLTPRVVPLVTRTHCRQEHKPGSDWGECRWSDWWFSAKSSEIESKVQLRCFATTCWLGEKMRHERMESPDLEKCGGALCRKWQTFKRPNLVSL